MAELDTKKTIADTSQNIGAVRGTNFTATTDSPDHNYLEKVRGSIDFNHPAEEAFRDGRENRAAAQVGEVEYERREVVDGDATYVIEDREDGPYIIARQAGEDPIRHYGENGLRLDEVPEVIPDKDLSDRVSDVATATFEGAEGAARGIGLGLTKFTTNVIKTAVQNPVGDFVLGEENVAEFEDFTNRFLENAEKIAKTSGIISEEGGLREFGDKGKEFGTTGQITKSIGDVTGQFIAPAGALYKGFRVLGAGPVVSSLLADAAVGFFGVSPDDENLANLIPEDSEAFAPIRDLIATDPEDSQFENRVRNATEAVALLGVGEAAGRGLVKIIESAKDIVSKVEIPEKLGKAIDDNVDKLIAAGAGAAATAVLAPAERVVFHGTDPKNLESIKKIGLKTGKEAPEGAVLGGGRDEAQSTISVSTNAKRARNFGNTQSSDMSLLKLEISPDAKIIDMPDIEDALDLEDLLPDLKEQGVDGVRIGDHTDEFSEQEIVFINTDALNVVDSAKIGRTQKVDDVGTGIFKPALAGAVGAAALAPGEAEAGGKSELVKKAGKLITKTGERIVPEDVANRARAALRATGNAEGIDFNLANMETTEQLDNLIDTISLVYKEPIKKAKRGVETFTETQAKADLSIKMGFDVEQVLSRQSGELWPAHRIKAARDIFVSELGKTDELARAIKSGENTSENLIAFRRQLAVVSGVQSQIKGVQTETARALSQYRMTAKSAMERQVNLAEMMQKSGGADVGETLVDAYLNVIENGGPDAAAAFARNAEQVTGWDMLYESWINSLLGSPSTHAVNMIGNSLTMTQSTVERFVAATYGAAERGVGKAFGKDIGGITFSEANAFAQGQVMAVNDGMVAFMKALKSGESSDIFGKIDHHAEAITTQHINELPLAKTITSKLMKGDELVKSNSQLAHMIDFMGEYYYRLPGRFLMAEDEFFKTVNYRAEIHALAAREGVQEGLTKEQQLARINDILEDPQLNAPELHQQSFDFARENTFTTPPGETAQALRGFLDSAEIGNFPAGRVVVPFFNVINNITKFVGGRVPGLGLINKNSKTYQDFFSKDPAKRQMIMSKWATGSSLLGFGAWSSMNGICTGRMTDNSRMRSQIEQTQGKKRYSCHLPGTDKMFSYNRLEPAGMLMAIAADTADAMAYIDDDEERQNLVLAATAAVVPYMEDKSFFNGMSRFFEAFNPQFGDDQARSQALGRYFTDLLASGPGAVGGPLAPNTPLSRNVRKNLVGDNAKRIAEANKWTIEKDDEGDEILVANSENYRLWSRTIKKIYSGTPGLSATLPADVNVWGEEIRYEGGLGPDMVTPIYTNTPRFDVKALQGKNFPPQIEAGKFRDMRVGSDITVEQHRKFVDVVGINGELERLNMPLNKPRSDISARVNGKVLGLPVEMNPSDRIDLIKIMNSLRVVNDAHPDRKRMNLQETLNWMIKQKEYAILPDDRDATGAKGDLIRKVFNEYKGASIEVFFAEHPKGQAYFRKSVEMKQKAQNTGVQ